MPYMYRNGIPICNRPGVYAIANLDNGKVYVGSALCLRGRMLYHRSYLRRGKHDNPLLQRAWEKYGESAFRFMVIESCEADRVVEREQYWINRLETTNRSKGYNICPLAGPGAMRGRKHSDESKAKMSADRKGTDTSKATAAAALANIGKPRSEEVRAKISASNAGKPKSDAHRRRVRENHWSRGPDAARIRARLAAKKQMRDAGEIF